MKEPFSTFNPPPASAEVMSDISDVETAGYLPADVQIEQLIDAGRRLGEYRKERYDLESTEDFDDIEPDPTRSGNFDMADATVLQRVVNGRLEQQKADFDAKAKADAENVAMAQESASEAKNGNT